MLIPSCNTGHRLRDTVAKVRSTHPEAMILGVPVSDARAPRIRVAGHEVSKFLAKLVTLRSGIGNPLFGFRVYPATAQLGTFAQTRSMQRFDFDSAAAIRLSWQGIPAINLPTPVRCFRREHGGVSHFHYLPDNLLLLFMYARLVAALLPRLPRPLAQRPRSAHTSPVMLDVQRRSPLPPGRT